MDKTLLVKRLEICLNFIEDCLITETENSIDEDAEMAHESLVLASETLFNLQDFLQKPQEI